MVSPFECPVCMNLYNFDTEQRAMSLTCGHTVCRDCISRMPTRTCPSCRAPFKHPVPNFTLYDIMTASASQARTAVQEQITSIAALVATVQADVTKCNAAIAAELVTSASTRSDLKSQLAAALMPLRSLSVVAGSVPAHTAAAVRPATPSNSNKRRRSSIANSNNSNNRHAQQEIILVDEAHLEDILERMWHEQDPAIYDFQGQEIQYHGNHNPTIRSAGVTWRNGTILLPRHVHSLTIAALGILFESITVVGGFHGVCITSGGCLTMMDCEIYDSRNGAFLDGDGNLVAIRLKVVNCGHGIYMEGESTAHIADCDISKAAESAITMLEHSNMAGSRVHVTDGSRHGVSLCDGAELLLADSVMTGGFRKLARMRNESALVLRYCEFDEDEEIDAEYPATVDIHG